MLNQIFNKKIILMIIIFTFFLFLLLFMKYGCSMAFLISMIITCSLVFISVIDFKLMIIPDKLVLFIFIIAVLSKLQNFSNRILISSIAGLLIGGGLFLLIAIVSKGAMGGGDIKLMAALGFLFSTKLILLNIFLSFWIGGLISIFLIFLKFKTRKDYIPFGPFIALSSYITMLYGNEIIYFYRNLMAL